jgi:glucose/arabinose dehydrogenase
MLLKTLPPVAALLAFGLTWLNEPAAPAPADTPENTYKTYCSSCHGEQVEMFVDRRWKFGNTKTELVASIAKGHPELGMPAWEASLKPVEIEALAEYIVDGIEKGKKYNFNAAPKSPTFTAASGMTLRLDTVARDLKNPWGLTFLPTGGVLVTDRSGKLYRVDGKGTRSEITGVPEVLAEGQGGLLDVELHPQFAKNRYVYLSYSAVKTTEEGKLSTTAIMRARLDGDRLTDQKVLFEAQPWAKTRHHYGSRLAFDKQGYLYFTVGDRGSEKTNPQSLESDAGKVHRIHDDGRVPADNPYAKSAHPTIYSYGHRNPQGMTFHPTTGALWAHEHGPRGGDEVNLVRQAKNYGWPVISYGINYDGKPITNLTEKEGMEQPVTYWVPSIAPSGMAFVTGKRYGDWTGDLLVGSLRFKYLNRCQLRDGKVVSQEILFPNIGRVRNVDMGPDGYAYVSVEDPGYVFRLVPVR